MNRIIPVLLIAFIVCMANVPDSVAQSTLQKQRSIHLFNGKNLDGWYTFIKDRGRNADPLKVFSVKDGVLHISGKEWGCITTTKEYKNYVLVLEYKWGDKTYDSRLNNARDNGVLFHSKGADGGYSGTWMHSLECNIIEGGTGDFIVVGNGTNDFLITSPVASEKQNGSYIYQPGGVPVTINAGRINWYNRDPEWKDEKGFRGKNDLENNIGEWNKLECVVKEKEIYIYLNGTLVNYAVYTKPDKGRIQIQAEGAEIFYRRIDLTALPSLPAYVPETYQQKVSSKTK